jgi:zinc D-Ala-D-Ala carboxypeptidase
LPQETIMSSRVHLSPNLLLSEFTVSQTVIRRGIPNTPSQAQIDNMVALCLRTLEPTRAHFVKIAPAGATRSIRVSSGFRGPELNRLVGGSSSSQHCQGEAADFVVTGVSVEEVFNWMAFGNDGKPSVPFDQLIYEFGQWIHVSLKKNGPQRSQILLARHERKLGRTRTVYDPVTAPLTVDPD